MLDFESARALLAEFKGGRYVHGFGVLPQAGRLAKDLGSRAALVCDEFPGSDGYRAVVEQSLAAEGLSVAGVVRGAAPNAPLEDLARIAAEVSAMEPELAVSFGGGSTIDAVKAATVLCALGGSIEDYFGTGLVSQRLAASGKSLLPHLAIQSASSSGAHLTKYSNITNLATGQKKLIVDDAVVPPRALFDYAVTAGAPPSLTADGALDGVSHCLEVLYGMVGKPGYEKIEAVALTGIRLVLQWLPAALAAPADAHAREALGLATDLGGYSIMLGGTNGAHLTSFSLIDILSHGRACAMLNPYYTVFFAPAIERPLRAVAEICVELDYAPAKVLGLKGRDLGVAVAEALTAFERKVGLPATLEEVPGFTPQHMERALAAAKNPQLRMKLENMPVPLTAAMVDEYMGPVLEAARTGRLDLIRNV